MAKFCTLASSSRGNSSWLNCGGSSILIDAGISCRRIISAIAQMGGDAGGISAVLITHEHTDHIKGLPNLIKKTGAEVFAPAAVLEYIAANGYVPPGARLTEAGEKPFFVGDIEISAFPTPHDSLDSAGYRITLPGGEAVGIVTDLGCVTGEVRRGVSGCRTVLLESNYDSRLLAMGSYPPRIKARIRSDLGHLENSESADFAAGLIESGTVRLLLGHLSRENNSPAVALQTAEMILKERGAVRGVDFELDAAPYDSPSRLLRF